MPDLPGAGAAWTCEACGRRVPGRVTACRCGATAPSPALTFDEAAGEVHGTVPSPASKTPWWWAAPGLVGLGLLAGLYLARPAPAPESSAPTPFVAEVDQDEEVVEVEDEAIVGESPATATRELSLPSIVTAPASPAGPTVEDLVAASLPAIVSVDAGQSRGTGFFVAPDLVVTNAHVIGQQIDATLRFDNGRTAPGRLERLSRELDLALLRSSVRLPDAAVLSLGAARGLRAGQEILVIGSPLGLQSTVTRGIVSALRDANGVLLVQTDAAINPGNSGGPLLDRQGRVVGIATLKQGEAESLGFAVAAEHARDLVDGRAPDREGAGLAAIGSMTAPGGAPPAEGLREHNEREFASAVQTLARRADQIDDYWNRFKTSCGGSPGVRRGDREWMGLVEAPATFTAMAPACSTWLSDLQKVTGELHLEVRDLLEAARRADILPGVVRDTLRAHRLSWD
jgi:S1-C subfamily serine protease